MVQSWEKRINFATISMQKNRMKEQILSVPFIYGHLGNFTKFTDSTIFTSFSQKKYVILYPKWSKVWMLNQLTTMLAM